MEFLPQLFLLFLNAYIIPVSRVFTNKIQNLVEFVNFHKIKTITKVWRARENSQSEFLLKIVNNRAEKLTGNGAPSSLKIKLKSHDFFTQQATYLTKRERDGRPRIQSSRTKRHTGRKSCNDSKWSRDCPESQHRPRWVQKALYTSVHSAVK